MTEMPPPPLLDGLSPAPADRPPLRLIAGLVGGALLLCGLALWLHLRAEGRTNHVALGAAPRPVTVQAARRTEHRPQRTYLGTLLPWTSARVGTQYVSAYVGAVLVRPGDQVQAGQVLATLDCRGASAQSRAVAARARALGERQAALSHELQRMQQLSEGGFTSQNEIEQLSARTHAESAELEGLRASQQAKVLEVDDCVLRAPFAGEVAERHVDPGAYARPGNPLVTILDRRTVRLWASVPETDFGLVAPGTAVSIEVVAGGRRLQAQINRRSPGADVSTRTVDFEADLPNADHALPAQTSAVVTVPAGAPRPAVSIPAPAATVRGDRASLFVVKGDRAARLRARVLGEGDGRLYLDPADVAPGSLVVIEGRALLSDGDRVTAQEVAP